MTHITCRLAAKNRDQLRNPTLGNRVWASFYTLCIGWLIRRVVWRTVGFDVERGSDESEECSVEHDRAVAVERHVHRHQPLQPQHRSSLAPAPARSRPLPYRNDTQQNATLRAAPDAVRCGAARTTAAHEVRRAGVLTRGSCNLERSARPHPHRG